MGVLWVLLLVAGFTILEREEFTPITGVPIGKNFPAHSLIQLASDKPTLLIFCHPYCPCSRASLHELDQLMTETANKISVIIVFTIPKGIAPGWEQGDLWKSATSMQGVKVLRDQDGLEAERFGVQGSGHALLYDSSGKLFFSGGITPSRGHEGDNPGRSAIASFVLTGHALVDHTPVFGCPLL